MGVNCYDYGFRFYDPALGRFTTQDPLAEKYFDYSPYQYAANNPINNIDVNGDSIFIYYNDANGDKQRQLYTQGMEYKGDNEFVTNTVNYLNAMNEVDAGSQVLSTLTGSKNSFDFTNTPSSGGNMTLQLDYKTDAKYKNGGAQIHAAALMNPKVDDVQRVEGTAHELFHGYQREMGSNPATVNGEVGAYLYGRGVASNSKYASPLISGFGTQSPSGQAYNMSMINMLYGWDNDYNKNYKAAVANFKTGSSANSAINPNTGKPLYDRHKVDPNYNPLILKFLPLIK